MSKASIIATNTEDEDYYETSTGSIAVIEEDQPEPLNTGLLDSYGNPIYKISVDKPPIGFITAPEFSELYDFDTQTDFYYSTD